MIELLAASSSVRVTTSLIPGGLLTDGFRRKHALIGCVLPLSGLMMVWGDDTKLS